MLQHYNYATSLREFLRHHQQLGDQNGDENEPTMHTLCEDISQESDTRIKNNSANNNKSFTIAAILGLKNHNTKTLNNTSSDIGFVNLRNHPSITNRSLICAHLQDPVNANNAVATVRCQECTSSKPTVRRLKHITSNVLPNKKICKSKRIRTIFTPEQLERLEAEFERQQYMVGPERLYLAHTLQLTEAQVKVWFQNRRIKWRKHHLEITQQRLAILKQQQMLLDRAHPDVHEANSSSTDNT